MSAQYPDSFAAEASILTYLLVRLTCSPVSPSRLSIRFAIPIIVLFWMRSIFSLCSRRASDLRSTSFSRASLYFSRFEVILTQNARHTATDTAIDEMQTIALMVEVLM